MFTSSAMFEIPMTRITHGMEIQLNSNRHFMQKRIMDGITVEGGQEDQFLLFIAHRPFQIYLLKSISKFIFVGIKEYIKKNVNKN